MNTENATVEPTAGFMQTPDVNTQDATNAVYTANPSAVTGATVTPDYRAIKRGRHPDVTKGAFGNKRKHNGIKFRTSALISRYV
jgi:hypothetical protein